MDSEEFDLDNLQRELGLTSEKMNVNFVTNVVPISHIQVWMNATIAQQAKNGAWLDEWKLFNLGNREFLIIMKFCWME